MYRQSPTATPKHDRSIPATALDEIPVDTDSEDKGLYWRILLPHSPAQESDNEDADHGETLMDEENPEIEVYPAADKTFGDDPDPNEFRDLIWKLW